MLRQWFKSPAVLALGAEGIALRPSGASADDIRMICGMSSSGSEHYSYERLLDELEAQADKLGLWRVRFILSNQFARYAVLPWQPSIYAMQDWLALATHQFRKQFGAMAENWEIRVALQGHGAPAVACALDRTLSERLLALSAKVNWSVQGIEPALMSVFNRHRAHLAKSGHWLLLAEPQRLLLGQISNGAWQHFHVDSPLAGEEPIAGMRMVERVLRLQGDTRPSAIACFGPAALLPDSLPEHMPMLRLPHPAAAVCMSSLDMLAGIA
ncbi:MAG: hypothetical protein ABI475_04055 [Methylophilaceae bacterium]